MTLSDHIAAVGKPNRPEHHFTPAHGWMNDPNGLVYFEGEYHLFYQYFPDDVVWGPMHWGHAISTDLMHWTRLPDALAPDDQGMCFSGSAVVDKHDATGLFNGKQGLVCFYTAHRIIGPSDTDYVQEQCIAYSQDKGRSWQKYDGNPVISTPGFRDFRDPKVFWHQASQAWIMSVACGQSIQFYRSHNLLEWTLASEFGAGQGKHTQGPWECPDLIPMPIAGSDQTRWVLIVGVGACEEALGSFTQYFVGDFDGHTFTNENPADTVLMLDNGRDFYATQSWSGLTGSRTLAISWASNWLYANQLPHHGWRGMMSLPRQFTLVQTPQGPRVQHAFADEVHRCFSQEFETQEGVDLKAGQSLLLATEQNSAADYTAISLELSLGGCLQWALSEAGCSVLTIKRDDQGYRVQHRRTGPKVSEQYDKTYPCDYALPAINKKVLHIEVCRDRGIQECLVNHGQYSITSLDTCTVEVDIPAPTRLEVMAGSLKMDAVVKAKA
ncbi:glycoside hydrolase family 32 protein [Halioxenophilus aromaticivorans]|uniref:Glycosyl hydrolase family 32 N-terminal domain-containing protein n=1 Tax=Halioxenophilus aromaticivorans TaxID=1306992 RepID=A0AAV3U877_9ALTE